MDRGEIVAVVYDAPQLRHYCANGGADKARMVPGLFDEQNYGFAFPEGSLLRENANRALPSIRGCGDYKALFSKYFGEK